MFAMALAAPVTPPAIAIGLLEQRCAEMEAKLKAVEEWADDLAKKLRDVEERLVLAENLVDQSDRCNKSWFDTSSSAIDKMSEELRKITRWLVSKGFDPKSQ